MKPRPARFEAEVIAAGTAVSARYGADRPFFRQLAPQLADVIAQAVFHITRLVEAMLHQRFDCASGGGSPERSHARIPPAPKFDVRRQAGVDESLRIGDRPFIEPGDSGSECRDERVEIGVRQGATGQGSYADFVEAFTVVMGSPLYLFVWETGGSLGYLALAMRLTPTKITARNVPQHSPDPPGASSVPDQACRGRISETEGVFQ
jgi:hypothetical protein